MASWNRDFTIEFIKLLHQQEPLWQVKHKDYRNKIKRKHCFDVLVRKMKEIDPAANRTKVQKKINNLRTVFRKEHRKMCQSLDSGCGIEDIYTPTLWYFNHLKFMKNDTEPLSTSISTSSINEDTRSSSEEREDLKPSLEILPPLRIMSSSDPDTSSPPRQSQTQREFRSPHRIYTPLSSASRFKRKRDIPTQKAMEVIGTNFSNIKEDDQSDVFGKNVAFKLRGLAHHQRLFAEKIINDTLFEAEMKNLNRYSSLVINESTHVSRQLHSHPMEATTTVFQSTHTSY